MVFEQGAGIPLVFIPGLQGRWEYTRSTVEALAAHFRVLTFSLADEPASGFAFDETRAFESYADHVRTAMDAAGVERAIVCGVSFGGLVALKFAASHAGRAAGLVLVSTPGPGWQLRKRHDLYARLPWLFGPLFLMEVPFRARPELLAALPDAAARRAFTRAVLRTVVAAPVSLPRMAARARRIGTYDSRSDCARITVPALIVTGEPSLDYVVPPDASSQYAQLIAGAKAAVLASTGHQGTITRPDAFAALVREFVDEMIPSSHHGQVA
jgi:pimeloyl-ACP methyl ester carboxylesterase